jgi:hypothetical protein
VIGLTAASVGMVLVLARRVALFDARERDRAKAAQVWPS